MGKKEIIMNGIFARNPVLFLVLGLCPSLAVTTSLENGLGMGISTLFVLFFSNTIISSLRGTIPSRVRIPAFIVVIATFVTIVSMSLQAYLPELNERLGIYIPLIVVNCIILARAEAFAKSNKITDSMADGIGMGLGFTLALMLIGSLRELLGTASLTLFGKVLVSFGTESIMLMILPPGALFTIGLIIASLNFSRQIKSGARVKQGSAVKNETPGESKPSGREASQ